MYYETTIHALFEQQVLKTPHAISVVFENEKLTYTDLNEQANQLAHHLREQMGVQSGDRVGLMVTRSTGMIVALIGILKAGATYVPIDVRLPSAIATDMLEETSVKAIILEAEFYINLIDFEAEFFLIDDELDDLTTPTINLGETSMPQDLAYVIYTSGSTGKRKGVALEHRAVVNTLLWGKQYYGFNEFDVKLQLPSVAFDSSVIDIFTILISGGQLVIPVEESRMDPRYLQQLILAHGVTNFLITPALYRLLLEQFDDHKAISHLTTLRSVTVAGEATTKALVQTHYKQLPDVALINEYGPTENAVCSTACQLHPDDERVSIGQPITNVDVYILNEMLEPMPVGEKGEIYLAGKGLAREYFNQPTLTKERFIPDPFSACGDQRMYKTGDIGSWRADGHIDFWGRADNQVKIRGFRVELGEIEQALLQYGAVQDAVVLCTEEGEQLDKQLSAFLVRKDELDVSSLRDDLRQRLPDYMIPNTFLLIDQVPLTANGKVDRKQLWALQKSQNKVNATIVLPRNDVEATLVHIWEKALDQNQVSVSDDFFDLGGNSLKAINTVNKIYKELGLQLSPVELYNRRTIEKLASWLTTEVNRSSRI